MKRRAQTFSSHLIQRRSVRDFSERPIPKGVLEACLESAVTAPNGANLQPWHFSVIRDSKIKKAIREAAEEEEKKFYNSRAPNEWLDSLAPIGTNAKKPFLETAPALVAIFQKSEITSPDGTVSRTYYSKESVGISTGFLISSLHHAGLATLTHTPSPMKFLLVRYQKSHFFCLSKDFLRQTVTFQIFTDSRPKKWSNFTDSKTKSD